jgi:Trk K+ transport system NAD-binding subunit
VVQASSPNHEKEEKKMKKMIHPEADVNAKLQIQVQNDQQLLLLLLVLTCLLPI